jgi:hypothetical protein
MLSVTMLSVVIAELQYAKNHYAERHSGKCLYAESRGGFKADSKSRAPTPTHQFEEKLQPVTLFVFADTSMQR